MRRPEDVEACGELDIDAIGLILVPNRKRTVTPKVALDLVQRLPRRIASVGVMANPTIDEVKGWLDKVPFNRIQLHGNESPELCRQIQTEIGVPIIKVIHVGEDKSEASLDAKAYAPVVDAVLLDSGAGKVKGGTGQSFAWERIPPFAEPWQKAGVPIWVAGGLHPENVAELVSRYSIAGVDTSSGVETEGNKDPVKMAQFVERVRNHDE